MVFVVPPSTLKAAPGDSTPRQGKGLGQEKDAAPELSSFKLHQLL